MNRFQDEQYGKLVVNNSMDWLKNRETVTTTLRSKQSSTNILLKKY